VVSKKSVTFAVGKPGRRDSASSPQFRNKHKKRCDFRHTQLSNNQKPTNYDTKLIEPLKGIEPFFPREFPLGVLTDRRKQQKK